MSYHTLHTELHIPKVTETTKLHNFKFRNLLQNPLILMSKIYNQFPSPEILPEDSSDNGSVTLLTK